MYKFSMFDLKDTLFKNLRSINQLCHHFDSEVTHYGENEGSLVPLYSLFANLPLVQDVISSWLKNIAESNSYEIVFIILSVM